jgi:hypothetical protein
MNFPSQPQIKARSHLPTYKTLQEFRVVKPQVFAIFLIVFQGVINVEAIYEERNTCLSKRLGTFLMHERWLKKCPSGRR